MSTSSGGACAGASSGGGTCELAAVAGEAMFEPLVATYAKALEPEVIRLR